MQCGSASCKQVSGIGPSETLTWPVSPDINRAFTSKREAEAYSQDLAASSLRFRKLYYEHGRRSFAYYLNG
jgi:hypothetical protein